VDYIQKRYSGEDVGIAFAYCDCKDNRKALELVASLARQLASQAELLPQELTDLYTQLNSRHQPINVQQLEALLMLLYGNFVRTYILIDALDEVNTLEERSKLLSTIRLLQNAPARVFVTSRPNFEDIKMQFSEVPQVEIVVTEEDIRTYLKEKIFGNSFFMTRICSLSGLQGEIVEMITSQASGM
jgi:hypothetical protein